MAFAANTLAPSPRSMLKQLKNIVNGITMFMAEMAFGSIMWLTITASVVVASCAATDVRIDALRKFFSAFEVTNEVRVCSLVPVFVINVCL
jgi:hypothetical protein